MYTHLYVCTHTYCIPCNINTFANLSCLQCAQISKRPKNTLHWAGKQGQGSKDREARAGKQGQGDTSFISC